MITAVRCRRKSDYDSYRLADDGRCLLYRCRRADRRVQGDGLQRLVIGDGRHQQHNGGLDRFFFPQREEGECIHPTGGSTMGGTQLVHGSRSKGTARPGGFCGSRWLDPGDSVEAVATSVGWALRPHHRANPAVGGRLGGRPDTPPLEDDRTLPGTLRELQKPNRSDGVSTCTETTMVLPIPPNT